ncbi:hypothetical protein F2P81_001014 [Scophthalmus maximus]|uniref:THAP domain-containing protein 1 n=1 Tax=Scophthalmus maximus TaxID=52904 RepID=A0A6A4TY19_SCOMX|nr:hypothetical protein F2P81_001014 [Scophthalmus maximus]
MGGCSAPNCSNSTRRGKQLFRFPRDPFRNKKWVKNCRREFEPDSASRLCQAAAMGGCSAPNCSNSTRRGKQLFRFPRDPFRNKKWVKNCRREFEPDSASRLCQDHFEQSQFEEIAKTAAGGKKLKPHAVPTLFRFRDRPYRAGSIPIAPYPPYATYAPIAPYILQPVKPEPEHKIKTRICGQERQFIFLRNRVLIQNVE